MFLERLSILIDSLLGFGYYLRMAKIVLGVCAHPDDLEFGCGGSIAKWVSEGATAYFLVLTDGSKGSEDPNITPEELKVIRRSEQEEAAKILGVKENFFLDYIDGELENNLELRKKIVRVMTQRWALLTTRTIGLVARLLWTPFSPLPEMPKPFLSF